MVGVNATVADHIVRSDVRDRLWDYTGEPPLRLDRGYDHVRHHNLEPECPRYDLGRPRSRTFPTECEWSDQPAFTPPRTARKKDSLRTEVITTYLEDSVPES